MDNGTRNGTRPRPSSRRRRAVRQSGLHSNPSHDGLRHQSPAKYSRAHTRGNYDNDCEQYRAPVLMEVSMAISVGQLQGFLSVDEPDYNSLARLGPSVLPYLEQFVASRDEYIAANAASLAGMIGGDRATTVLERAARSHSPVVRAAAAAAFGRVESPRASALLATLLSDRDKGVRKFAIKASAGKTSAALAARIADLSRRDPMPHLRSLATRVRGRMRVPQ